MLSLACDGVAILPEVRHAVVVTVGKLWKALNAPGSLLPVYPLIPIALPLYILFSESTFTIDALVPHTPLRQFVLDLSCSWLSLG